MRCNEYIQDHVSMSRTAAANQDTQGCVALAPTWGNAGLVNIGIITTFSPTQLSNSTLHAPITPCLQVCPTPPPPPPLSSLTPLVTPCSLTIALIPNSTPPTTPPHPPRPRRSTNTPPQTPSPTPPRTPPPAPAKKPSRPPCPTSGRRRSATWTSASRCPAT